MVILKQKVDPADVQAKINVVLSIDPTISLSDPEAELHITLTLSINSSVKEGRPITIVTDRSVFDAYDKDKKLDCVDIFAEGGFSNLKSTEDSSKNISFGCFRTPHKCTCHSQDARELNYRMITIPGDGSTVIVTHKLTWARIFRNEKKRAKSDLVPGERFKIKISEKYFFTTLWWYWGDLETDLKDKKLHVWRYGEKPSDEYVREGNWVLGETNSLLDWQNVTKDDGWVSFEVIA